MFTKFSIVSDVCPMLKGEDVTSASMNTGGSALAEGVPSVPVIPWELSTMTVMMRLVSVSAGRGWGEPGVMPAWWATMVSADMAAPSVPPAPSLAMSVILTLDDVFVPS